MGRAGWAPVGLGKREGDETGVISWCANSCRDLAGPPLESLTALVGVAEWEGRKTGGAGGARNLTDSMVCECYANASRGLAGPPGESTALVGLGEREKHES